MTAKQPPIGTGGGPPGQPWYTQMWATAAAIVAVVVIAIIVVVVAFAGGDGDGDGDDEIAQASPTAEEPAGEVSPTGGDDGDDGDGEDGEDGEDGRDGGDGGDGYGAREGAIADLEALASRAVEGVTAKVTYRVTSEVGGEVNDAEWAGATAAGFSHRVRGHD